MKTHLFNILVVIFCALAGTMDAQDKKLFELLPSTTTGVTFRNTITESREFNALTYENLYNGGGIAAGDINNDGLIDIYFVSNMQQNKLYLNLGDFRFKDITASSGTGGTEGWKSGAVMVDINGDQLLDIYVCYSGKNSPEKRRNKFFINQGNMVFIDKAQEMGLADDSYSTQAAFFDYDKDGDLDMFLLATNVNVIRDLEYADARRKKHPYAGDKLFRNDHGKFTEVTEQAGILSNALGFGLGIAVADINKDGWQDMYVSNDYAEPDYLYINNGDGTFTNRLAEYIKHISQFSMGSDIADVNNDSWPDIFTADMLPEDNKRQKILYGPENYEQFALMVKEGYHYQHMRNMLQINNGDNTFSEVGQLAGVSNTDWSWAGLFADYDNDGWKDLFVTNGYFRDYTNRDFLKYKGDYYFKKAVAREKPDTLQLVSSMTSTPVHNYIFRNTGGVSFENKSEQWGFNRPTFSNGAAYADFDNDGDLDLVISNQNEEASLYRNLARESGVAANFLAVRLKGREQNSRAWGARVTVYSAGGKQYLEQMPVRGYQSSVSDQLHFGLGAFNKADSVVVTWLNGGQVVLTDVTANRVLEVTEERKHKPAGGVQVAASKIFQRVESPIRYSFSEYGSNDFKRQPLLMTMLSACGPVMATGDINGDGLADVFAGGTRENPGKIFIQTSDGMFIPSPWFAFKEDFDCTDADALFFDADGDHDQDLYVVSGGYHDYSSTAVPLRDRLYINDGKGKFTRDVGNSLPEMIGAKSCVRASDFDLDGDLDLFVGGRVIPGLYPTAPPSYVLINDGTGRFSDARELLMSGLLTNDMVTDALWVDLNNDKYADLVVTGEFMPVRVFINDQGKKFQEKTKEYFGRADSGLWSRLRMADFDRDGDFDLIAGNFGLNSQLKVSDSEPLSLTYKDFDKNGSVDPILVSYNMGKPYPFASRDELLDQIYAMRRKFPSYASYSEAGLNDIFSPEDLVDSRTLLVNELHSVYYENVGGAFKKHILPVEAQYAPVFAIEVLDFDRDGSLDFILGGNQSSIRIRLGVIDANYGQLFRNDGKGNFKYIPQAESGLSIFGDVKSLKLMRVGKETFLFAGINNSGVVAYKQRPE